MICSILWFNAIWQRPSLAALFLCWRLAESDVTVMPSVTGVSEHTGDVITQVM